MPWKKMTYGDQGWWQFDDGGPGPYYKTGYFTLPPDYDPYNAGGLWPPEPEGEPPAGQRDRNSAGGDTGGGGDKTYDTRLGPKTEAEIRAIVNSIGGNGNDPNFDNVLAALERAKPGASAGSKQPGYAPGSGYYGTPGEGSGDGTSFPMAGGLSQLQYDIDLKNQALLRRRLQELDIPGLNLQRRAQIFSEINALRNTTGYINPEREARDIPGYTDPVEQGGYGYKMPEWFKLPEKPAPPPAHSGDEPPPDASGDWVREGPNWRNKRTGAGQPGKFTSPWVPPFEDPHVTPPKPVPPPYEGPGPVRGPEDDIWAQMRSGWIRR